VNGTNPDDTSLDVIKTITDHVFTKGKTTSAVFFNTDEKRTRN
jgi:hypothetical protein